MVSSMKAKTRRSISLQIDCLIYIQEIKPWPPSQSLRSVRSVMIQWENGDRHSGSTNVVVPNLGSVAGEGRIEFNESFRLPVTLVRDMVIKVAGGDTFQKNCLQFHLYELRREKTSKGQLLASATIDLADYGDVKEALCVNAQMNCKRSFGNMNQPVLYIKIQPIDKGLTCSSTRDSLSLLRVMSFDSTIGESVLTLISEEYSEENEVGSITDDSISPHSSMTVFSSNKEIGGVLPLQSEENGHVSITQNLGASGNEHALISGNNESSVLLENGVLENLKAGSSSSSSLDLPSDPGSPINDRTSIHGWPHSGSIPSLKNSSNNDSVHSSSSSSNGTTEDVLRSNDHEYLREEIHEKNVLGRDCLIEVARGVETYNCSIKEKDVEDIQEDTHKLEKKSKITDNEIPHRKDGTCRQDLSDGDVLLSGKGNSGIKSNDRLQHAKSVRSSTDSVWNKGLLTNQMSEGKGDDALEHAQRNTGSLGSNEKKDTKIYPKDTQSSILDCKIQQLHHRIRLLEGELREAAAIEASLYSAVAEHGSSVSKVHAPARRLLRLYLHSCKENSNSQKASAARSAVSGLVLIAKACGNDVSRLTFWLSNSCVLRTVIRQINEDVGRKYSVGSEIERNGCSKEINNISRVKGKTASSEKRGEFNFMHGESFGDWGDPQTFILALENFEAWMFSRIIESIWWQTLTPHMQSSAAKSVGRISSPDSGKSYKRILSIDQEQRTLSLDLWKDAFKDASERICPVRAGGHECGCLPILAKLIMEQCVARLDVAMFNAILRESAEEIPTDPVSDPISDCKVLPIPAGKSSFGAGAQLKNAIGNWSRWLTYLFGMDDNYQTRNENDDSDKQDTGFKAFHLLNALSDLMILPKDMLLDRTMRRKVCPTFGSLLIKRVLDNFVLDEFCPDPIPDAVLESLNSEDCDSIEAGEQLISNFPCSAAPIVYSPPVAASLAGIAGIAGEIGQSELRRSGSSLLRKSYTSDDELDELNSPLDSILMDVSWSSPASTKLSWISKEKNQNAIRYELLREIWMNGD